MRPTDTEAGAYGYIVGSIATSASANTKGSWVQLIASVPVRVDALRFGFAYGASGVANTALLDIGVGSAGNEVAIVSDMLCGYTFGGTDVIPVSIESGERLSMRWQSGVASTAAGSAYMDLLQFTDERVPPSSLVTMGANGATSKGVALSTKNTWYEVEDSTSADFDAVIIAPASDDAAMGASYAMFEVAIGASSSETVIGTGMRYSTGAAETMGLATFGASNLIPFPVPAGSRLSARVIDSSANNTGYNVVLLGVPSS